MKVIKTPLEGVVEIEPDVYEDERGHFFESYNFKKFKEQRIFDNFVQDNQSKSSRGVLRGLHFQKYPFSQGKLVRVVKGKIFDVAVDLRKNSSTFGKWFGTILSEENKKMLWISEGLAHGFLALEDNSILSYKCTNYYNKDSDSGILWSDKDLDVMWPFEKFGIKEIIVSEKDSKLQSLKDYLKNPSFM